MIREDRIDAATGEVATEDLSRAYFVAFDQVRVKLKERWRLNQYSKHNHPGWDLSLFGYVTKTLRDQEFSTRGDVPGGCIREGSYSSFGRCCSLRPAAQVERRQGCKVPRRRRCKQR
jgi:hypothetical protein